MRRIIPMSILLAAAPAPALSADISTHVLDLARGVGGSGVPVTLSRRDKDGRWTEVARGRTDADGRVRSFGPGASFGPADYRLHFDLSGYPDSKAMPFFPEIDLTFRVGDAAAHYHVPVVLSPYGYSTYRGN
ncbi:5-hydroxyisourate hydrolase [Sphingomonas sp. Leaf412]|uniref:hydroxyisourate hydrolase n=1 Tax=Sphingomonas sp. Leaf412 TaxID=1736370 RepID=UPI0006F91C66|nr:hydroxyisourate hydrolase [Sphingomonas sp. Leaf412]KQT33014.1 5-hydroxyisourate hydrolase [Sphingomonas sp. Leaf412]